VVKIPEATRDADKYPGNHEQLLKEGAVMIQTRYENLFFDWLKTAHAGLFNDLRGEAIANVREQLEDFLSGEANPFSASDVPGNPYAVIVYDQLFMLDYDRLAQLVIDAKESQPTEGE